MVKAAGDTSHTVTSALHNFKSLSQKTEDKRSEAFKEMKQDGFLTIKPAAAQ